ncbi:MAG TPA: exodeoxyribonuclease VII large subunit [Acidimicrobiales bacterium]|nr:exodeoxyribonuclease VII large subunit [Acidimicrobiales bacterium]
MEPGTAQLLPEQRPDVLSIATLLDQVQAAITRAFPRGQLVWVRGEVQSITDRTGHCYIDLVDPDAPRGRDTKVLKVNCWARTWAPMKAALDRQGIVLEVGTVVTLRGRVEFYAPRAQVNFIAVDVDVDALLGRLAARRAALLKALESEGLLRRNATLSVPDLALRVGLVASPGTEGFNDFLGQLEGSGLAFTVVVVRAQVQGTAAPAALARGIAALAAAACDLVVLVRGGGSKADLAAFDTEPVARAIALCPVPVWTGIGHTGDQSVADVVAGRAFVTPTECGQELVQRAGEWWNGVLAAASWVARRATETLDGAEVRDTVARRRLGQATRQQLHRHSERLDGHARRIASQARRQLDVAALAIDHRSARIGPCAHRAVAHHDERLQSWRRLLAAYDVERQLERGYTLTLGEDGRVIRSAAVLETGSLIVTRFADGTAVSGVREVIVAPGRPEAGASQKPAGEERS